MSEKVKVGTDDYLRDIFVGDEIKDSEGRLYTVDPQGRAVALHGPGDYPLSQLHGVEVVSRARPKVDVDSTKARQVRPYLKRNTNATGRIRLSNLARKRGVAGADFRQLAESIGIPVVIDNKHNATIDVKDGQRLLDAFDSLEPEGKQVTVGVSVNVEEVTDDFIIQEVVRRGLQDHFVGGQGIKSSDPAKIPTKEDALQQLEDQDLADALRRRGFEVNAVKRVVL